MYYMTMNSAAGDGCYHHDREAGRAPVVAAHNIETSISAMVGDQSVDVYKLEPVYDSPDGDITGWVEVGEPVRLWRELVDLRDSVDVHDTAIMGSRAFAVNVRGSGAQLLFVEVEWHQNAR